MGMKKVLAVVIASTIFSIGFVTEASAESIRLRCEVRKKQRAKISVDGRNVNPGVYRAAVTSGGVTVESKDTQSPVGGEVEFDFDSNRNDVAEGATQLAKGFIKDNMVSATIVDQDGFAIGPVVKTCKLKK
ncbi:hypothetical protein MCAMS1_01586 [biofilm metagenome]